MRGIYRVAYFLAGAVGVVGIKEGLGKGPTILLVAFVVVAVLAGDYMLRRRRNRDT